MTIRWEAAGATHVGRVRRSNEDSFRLDVEGGIFVVADGMGGHAAGEIASSLAVEAVMRHFTAAAPGGGIPADRVRIREAFEVAQHAIIVCCEGNPKTEGMGTTLTVALLDERGGLVLGHLGDSRAYLLHAASVSTLTRDHTWVQREVDAGRIAPAAAREHPLGHVLTRVLTADDPADPDVETASVSAGDVLLLCTDGLYNHLDERSIGEILAARTSASDAVTRLLKEANRRGGSDNVTAVVVQILSQSAMATDDA